MPDQIDPSPAQLGDSTTIVPDTWTVIDDAGTEIYLYGDQIRQPVTIVVRSGQDSPTTSADRDQARAERDTLRQALHAAETLLSQARDDARRASVERDQARAELIDARTRLVDTAADLEVARGDRDAALALTRRQLDRWRPVVNAARAWRACRNRGIDGAIYHRSCTDLAAAVDALGQHAAPVPDAPAPEPTGHEAHLRAQRFEQWCASCQDGMTYPGSGRLAAPDATAPVPASRAALAVIAQGTGNRFPCPPRETDPGNGGDRTRGGDHGAQGGAEPAGSWSHVDVDGDGIDIDPRLDSATGWVVNASADGAYLTRADAASLHAWLGQRLGTAPSTPDRPEPGPQDIPPEWMLVHLRRVNIEASLDIADDELLDHPDTDPYRQAIRSAYRVGYAAAHGCEITVAPEGDYIHIGDRWPAGDTEAIECPSLADVLSGRSRRVHVDAECGWCADIRQHHTP